MVSMRSNRKLNDMVWMWRSAPLACVLAALAVLGFSTKPATLDPLPPPATYQVDPVHSFVYFSAWHHVVGTVRGRFEKVTGTITAAPKPEDCVVDITIDTA